MLVQNRRNNPTVSYAYMRMSTSMLNRETLEPINSQMPKQLSYLHTPNMSVRRTRTVAAIKQKRKPMKIYKRKNYRCSPALKILY